MRKLLAPILVICGLLSQGCTKAPDVTMTLAVDSGDPATIEATRRKLQARFEEFPPSMFSTVESKATGSTVSFTFRNGAPSPQVLEYLYSTPGHVRAALASGGSTWLAESLWLAPGSCFEDRRHLSSAVTRRQSGAAR
jgi:hypothetical protein